MSDLIGRIRDLSPGQRADLRQQLWDRGLPTTELDDPGSDPPASFTQRRLLFLHEIDPGSHAYHSPTAYRLVGQLDVAALAEALNDCQARHEVLRAALPVREGRPVQHIAAPRRRPLPVIDLSGLPEPHRHRETERLLQAEPRDPFDLTGGPLVRYGLLRLSPVEAVLMVTFHHAVVDGWSISVFLRDLARLYEARRAGGPVDLPSLPVQHAEYARWQQDWAQGDEAGRQLDYWQRQLAGAPEVLTVPTDRPRPVVAGHHGETYRFRIDGAARDRLVALGARGGASLFMTLLAGLHIVLARYSGQRDVVIGTPVANRRHRVVHDLIGFFANSVALRTPVRPDETFAELLDRVRRTCLDAYEHQDVPLDLVARRLHPDRDLGRNPIYQVNFTLHNTPEPVRGMAGLAITPLEVDDRAARFDLDLNVVEEPDGLRCALIYASDLFDAATVERIVDSLVTVLTEVAADPGVRVGDLSMLGPADLDRVLREDNATDHPLPEDLCVHRLFEARAAAEPSAIAVSTAEGSLTYGELDRRADQVARCLLEAGTRRGDVVGVLLSPSAPLLATLLGVLKAGAAFLALNPSDPSPRLQRMWDDSGAKVLVTESGLADRLDAGDARTLRTDRSPAAADRPLPTSCHAEDPMYLIYTSGSTGGPKGTLVTHRGVANYLLWAVGEFAGAEGTGGAPLHSSLAVDLTVTTLFAPLLAGRTVVVPAASEVPGEALAASARADRDLTFVKLTPSHLRLLDQAGAHDRGDAWCRTLVIGGEDLRAEHLAPWRASAAVTHLINEYGPTETSVACAAYRVAAGDEPAGRVPIGTPIHNTQLYVLDEGMRPVPIGAPGELYVGGAGVALGYRNRPELTAERFLPDPFGTRPGSRLYRTGDLVRRRADGNLEYLGRQDDQLKIRGHRVEPGEIAHVIAEHPDVTECAIEYDRDAPEDRRLVAVVAVDRPAPTAGQRDERLAQWRRVYDEDVYRELDADADPELRLAGWTSSYTGAPMDRTEMRSWLDRTVTSIRGLRPRRVLELGIGTGMILTRIAPDCASYHGVDLSAAAVDHVRRRVLDIPGGADIALDVAPAHQGVPAGRTFDTVILNSVIQYFPSADYLMDVLHKALEVVEPGGHIFVGDVRSLPLQEAFRTSVAAYRAEPGSSVGRLRADVLRALDAEEELCLDPRFFHGLPERLPRVTAVRVLLKRGRDANELVRYRYDVVLDVDGTPSVVTESWDWTDRAMTVAGLAELLTRERPARLAVSGVPNARLGADLGLLGAVAGAAGDLPLAACLVPGTSAPGVDPEELAELGERLAYRVELSWAQGHRDGAFDVLLTRADQTVPAALPGPVGDELTVRRHANDPLWRDRAVAALPAIEEHVREHLPEPLVPSRFVLVSRLPLTPGGKLDRAVLGRLARTHSDLRTVDDATPADGPSLTDTERRIAGIWTELLGRDRIRPQDDFFDLGGHSLLTFQLVFRLRREFAVEVPIRAPFEASTLAALARLVDGLAAGEAEPETPALARVPRAESMPASFAQERLWFVQQLYPDSVQYNFPIFLRLRGDLSPAALVTAVDTVVGRHEVLRTVLVAPNGEPRQVILPARPHDPPLIDLSGLAPARRDTELARLGRDQYAQPFDLSRPPVVRVAVVRLAGDEHVLLLTMHHVAVDAWSAALLLQELVECYTAACERRPPRLPELAVQYADYAVWQRRSAEAGRYAGDREYWGERLRGVLELPRLPTDRPRPDHPAHAGGVLHFRIPPGPAAALRTLCAEEDATLFMGLLAGLYALVHSRTGQLDVAVGSDVANRSDTAVERLVGFFVNQVVLRVELTGSPSWRELLRRTRSTTLDAYGHQDLPYEEVVKMLNPPRGGNPNPLFQIKIVLDSTPEASPALPGLTLEPAGLDVIDTSRFDLVLLLRAGVEGIEGTWDFDAELFDPETVAGLRDDYLALMAAMTDRPDDPVGRPEPEPVPAPQGRAESPGTAKRGGFRRMAPKPVTVAPDTVVARSRLGDRPLPMVLTAARTDVDLAGWAAAHRQTLEADLHAAGALLFRDFAVTEPADLERFASVFVTELFGENGEHPRAALSGNVYTPVFFPPEEKLLWHNENSFNAEAPAKIWFCCREPAETGGETPIADSREVYRSLDPQLRDEFVRKGVRYVRNYGTGLGLDWRTVFRTDDRAQAEAECEAQDLTYEWRGDRLRTMATRPAAIRHPVTGDWSWFNQAQHWHVACLPAAARESLLATVAADELPRSCEFGDGTPIPDAAMAEICRVYEAAETSFPWQRGDVLMVDNILVAHARNPFRGHRELLVAMGEMVKVR